MNTGAKKKNFCPLKASAVWPPTTMVDDAISSPRKRAPASPMKIRARCTLCGRNPRHTPQQITASSGPTLSDGSSPLWESLWL